MHIGAAWGIRESLHQSLCSGLDGPADKQASEGREDCRTRWIQDTAGLIPWPGNQGRQRIGTVTHGVGTHREPQGSYKDGFKLKTPDIQQKQEEALSQLHLPEPKQKLLRNELSRGETRINRP